MIDPETETLFALAQGPSKPRHKVSPATRWRWALRGLHGNLLETIMMGGRRYSSEEAYARFIARLNEVAVPRCEAAAGKPQVGHVQSRTESDQAARRAAEIF